MQLVAGRWFRENWNAEVTVASVHSKHDRHLYQKFGFKSVRSSRRGFFPLLSQLTAAFILGRAPKIIQRRLTRSTSELGSIIRSDLVVDLSGDMLTESHGIKLAISHFGPLMTAHLLRVPYFICAQSIGPFRKLRRLAKFLLSNALKVTTREPISTLWLNGFDVRADQHADLAFLLTPTAPPKLDQDPTIGVNVSTLYADLYHSFTQRSIVDELAKALNRLCRPVILIPHVTGPNPSQDDRTILAELREKLTCPNQFVDDDLGPSEIKALIAATTVFIGARFHSCIAALSTQVPTIALSYSHKSLGIMSSVGLQNFVLDYQGTSAQTIEQLVEEILSNPHLAIIDSQSLDDLRMLARENFTSLTALFS